jgi:hypothetical protein
VAARVGDVWSSSGVMMSGHRQGNVGIMAIDSGGNKET